MERPTSRRQRPARWSARFCAGLVLSTFCATASLSARQQELAAEIDRLSSELLQARLARPDRIDASARSCAAALHELAQSLLELAADGSLSRAEGLQFLRLSAALQGLPGELLAREERDVIRAAAETYARRCVAETPDEPLQVTELARFLGDQGLLAVQAELLAREVAHFEQPGHREPAFQVEVLGLLAKACRLLGQADEAQRAFDRSGELLSGVPSDDTRAFFTVLHASQGVIRALDLGRLDRANGHLRRMEEALGVYDQPPMPFFHLDARARIYQASGASELVEKLLGASVEAQADPELSILHAIARLKRANIGRVALDGAVLDMRRALVRNPPSAPRAAGLFELAEALERGGRLAEARLVARELEQCTQELPASSLAGRRWGGALLTLDTALAWKAEHDVEALRKRLPELEAAFAAELALGLRRAPSDEPGLFYFPSDFALPSALTWARLWLGEPPEAALEAALSLEAAHDLALAVGSAAPKIADLRARLLGPEHGLIVYFASQALVGPCLVFALDDEGLSWAPIHDTYAWESLPRELRAHITPPPKGTSRQDEQRLANEASAALRELGAQFLPEAVARRAARWKRWTVVGDDLFGELPFDGLEVEGIGTLGLEKEIDHSPSLAWTLARLDAPEGTRTAESLVLASAELAAIDETLWRKLVERDWKEVFARKDTLQLGAELPSGLSARTFDVASILAHGTFDERTLGPALSLGGAKLAFDSVAELPRARVYLLGACGASAGTSLRWNAGMSHFGGTLLGRGARCVVLGSGEHPLAATSALLGRAHAELLRGASPAAALRTARRALVASGSTHPADHVLLEVYGLGQTVP